MQVQCAGVEARETGTWIAASRRSRRSWTKRVTRGVRDDVSAGGSFDGATIRSAATASSIDLREVRAVDACRGRVSHAIEAASQTAAVRHLLIPASSGPHHATKIGIERRDEVPGTSAIRRLGGRCLREGGGSSDGLDRLLDVSSSVDQLLTETRMTSRSRQREPDIHTVPSAIRDAVDGAGALVGPERDADLGEHDLVERPSTPSIAPMPSAIARALRDEARRPGQRRRSRPSERSAAHTGTPRARRENRAPSNGSPGPPSSAIR